MSDRCVEMEIVDLMGDLDRPVKLLAVQMGMWAGDADIEDDWRYVQTIFDKKLAIETATRLLELAAELP